MFKKVGEKDVALVVATMFGIICALTSQTLTIDVARDLYRATGSVAAFKVWRLTKHGEWPSEQLMAAFDQDLKEYHRATLGPCYVPRASERYVPRATERKERGRLGRLWGRVIGRCTQVGETH